PLRPFSLPLLALCSGFFASGGIASGEPPHPHEPEFGPDIEPRGPEGEPIERYKVPFQDGMLRIPGGEFVMGYEGPLPAEPNEKPAHAVRISPFWIDRTEVTTGDMRACLDRGSCTARLGSGPTCTWAGSTRRCPSTAFPGWRPTLTAAPSASGFLPRPS